MSWVPRRDRIHPELTSARARGSLEISIDPHMSKKISSSGYGEMTRWRSIRRLLDRELRVHHSISEKSGCNREACPPRSWEAPSNRFIFALHSPQILPGLPLFQLQATHDAHVADKPPARLLQMRTPPSTSTKAFGLPFEEEENMRIGVEGKEEVGGRICVQSKRTGRGLPLRNWTSGSVE
ncbi:hypothetical protein MVEN_01147800 [Mycena venus]|uniref:Uncharacterized protein n=1 Tax=Mycena venus TaxID=2733690 RepID=A0A8H6Y233_9AGAR|nr:hypothetical protein MVEN_01147800 [Mycena venus]